MKKQVLFIFAFIIALSNIRLSAQTSPTGYTTTTFINGLINPVAFLFAPDGRVFITQKGGTAATTTNAKIFTYSSLGTLLATFYDLTDSVNASVERGLLGVTLDPNFSSNHYLYVYYVHKYNNLNSFRVVKFTEQNNVGKNPVVILNIPVANNIPGNHVGGNIHFRKSEPTKLYVTIGEIATPANAQILTNPFGKFLRINTDGSIPTDNPFYDDGNPSTGNDDRIWSYGHRNAFDFTFGPNDTHYTSENGENTWDEANVVEKGKNYGWGTCEGNYLRGSTTQPCNNSSYTAPIATWGANFGPQSVKLPSVTGILYYSGTVLPEFDNHLLVTDNNFGDIFDLTLGNPPKYDVVTKNSLWFDLVSGAGGLTTIEEGADGNIYALLGGYTNTGTIFKITKKGSSITESTTLENAISQNYPNPANNSTQVDYSLIKAGKVTISLFDITGREAKKVLTDLETTAGKHTITFQGLNTLTEGTYFYTIRVTDNSNNLIYLATKRILISH